MKSKKSRKTRKTSLVKKGLIKITALCLIISLNWFGLSAIGETLSDFNDIENAPENTINAGILDFSLDASSWEVRETASNLMPDDSITRSVNIVNDGTLLFQYNATTTKISGDDDFCNALELEAKLDDVVQYNGLLMGFATSSISFSATTSDWLFKITLPATAPDELQNKSCQFKFIFVGRQDSPPSPTPGGFWDGEEIENDIQSGTWIIPNTNEYSPIADSYIDQTQRNKNYGASQELQVRSKIGSGANKRTFVAFDFHFPVDTIISSSYLKLYMKTAPPDSRDYEVRRVLENWKERDPNGIDWNNQPNVFANPTDTISTGDATPKWLSWDVTNDVIFFTTATGNNGWRIGDVIEEEPNPRQAKFHSRESNTESKRPVLEITFSAPAATTNHLVINEVYYDVGSGKGNDPKNEWIEIYNPTDAEVDISNWQICDNNTCDTIPSSSPIPAKGFAVVSGKDSTWTDFWSMPTGTVLIDLTGDKIGNGLNDDGDRLILKDASSATIDAISYGNDISQLDPSIYTSRKGKSLSRIVKGYDTDLATDWVINATPNPGTNPSEGGTEIMRFTSEGIEVASSEANLEPLPTEEWIEEEIIEEEPEEEPIIEVSEEAVSQETETENSDELLPITSVDNILETPTTTEIIITEEIAPQEPIVEVDETEEQTNVSIEEISSEEIVNVEETENILTNEENSAIEEESVEEEPVIDTSAVIEEEQPEEIIITEPQPAIEEQMEVAPTDNNSGENISGDGNDGDTSGDTSDTSGENGSPIENITTTE